MKIQLTRTGKSRRLTLWGWLTVAGGVALLTYIWFVTIHDFLALNEPVNAPVLVVEGYVPDYVLDSVAVVWKNKPSVLIVCAGLPVRKGEFCVGYGSYADYNTAYLRANGVDSLHVVSAPALQTDRERTYTTAVAAMERLKALGYASGKVDVVCLGTHARRSLLLYRKAFRHGWNVGVISYGADYPRQWWRTSEGARAVVYEMFAYLYCAIFFHP
ncbi:MAG: hypothetical protein LBL24_00790 [Bacteroidales bacterium]|jgi:hypothetical protein|nr:hypothetical protein [Bacteroidales bacterium]